MEKLMLQKVAQELNEKMGLDPPITIHGAKWEYLESKIREAIQEIIPRDKFTAETTGVLRNYFNAEVIWKESL